MLNQKALELLDFVSDGKVRYPGYNAELFGDNVQVETKEEAEDRVYRFVTEEASSKFLLEYAKSIKGSGNPESEIKTHPIYYDRDTYRYSDSYSESMKKECAEVIKSVTQKLINKIPDFTAEAYKEADAAKKREIEEKKAEQKKRSIMIIFHVCQRKEHSLRKKQKMLSLSPC